MVIIGTRFEQTRLSTRQQSSCSTSHQRHLPRIQTKLQLNRPGDQYEQEADRIADQVMRMPAPRTSFAASESGQPSRTRNPLQAKTEDGTDISSATASVPSLVDGIETIGGSGVPLSPQSRVFFENRMGWNFGNVRIHTDTQAARTSQLLHAKAFTTGNHIAFSPGEYQPGTATGDKLLAHELTHVIQQSNGEGLRVQRSVSDGAFTPSPAPGAQPPSPPAPTTQQPTAEESAPVTLPREGNLRIVFSSGRRFAFEINDLSEFGIGKGVLETPPIKIGNFISASAMIGSNTPFTLTQPSLTLSQVIGSISATDIAQYRSKEQTHETARTALGATRAVFGGITGGIIGGIVGFAKGGSKEEYDELKARPGQQAELRKSPPSRKDVFADAVVGMIKGAKSGAETGGAIAGSVSDTIYNFIEGDFDLIARLDEGQISGELGMKYNPYVGLKFFATGFEWLAKIIAKLETRLELLVKPTISLKDSNVTLHFRNGKLERTIFTLSPKTELNLIFDADARLMLEGDFLNILKDSAGNDKPLLSVNFNTDYFPLFHDNRTYGANTEFTFAKGSPMEILEKNMHADDGKTSESFVKLLIEGMKGLPLLQNDEEIKEMSRTGLNDTDDDAILMNWYKKLEMYPKELHRPSTKKAGMEEYFPIWPHRYYGNGLSLGVVTFPQKGDRLKYRGGENREAGVPQFINMLLDEDILLEDILAYKFDIDHVVDWAFYGDDDETNLWPLFNTFNRSVGGHHSSQRVWWALDKTQPPQKTAIHKVPKDRYFKIQETFLPNAFKEEE